MLAGCESKQRPDKVWCSGRSRYRIIGDWPLEYGMLEPAGADLIFSDRFENLPFSDCAECPDMVMILTGTFTQGSPESEPQSIDIERPQREVNV